MVTQGRTAGDEGTSVQPRAQCGNPLRIEYVNPSALAHTRREYDILTNRRRSATARTRHPDLAFIRDLLGQLAACGVLDVFCL